MNIVQWLQDSVRYAFASGFLDQEVCWNTTLEDSDEGESYAEDGVDPRCNIYDSSLPFPHNDPEEKDCQTDFQGDSGQDVYTHQ